jgi:hypothetical protein
MSVVTTTKKSNQFSPSIEQFLQNPWFADDEFREFFLLLNIFGDHTPLVNVNKTLWNITMRQKKLGKSM